jgi:hypothetical protein
MAIASIQGQVQSSHRKRDEFHVEAYSLSDLAFHIAGGALNMALQIAALWWIAARSGYSRFSAGGILVTLLAAMFVADFVSGFLHWMFDTWWSETTPIVRRMVIMVREHHVYPGRIFKFGIFHDAGTLSWITVFLTLPLYVAVWLTKVTTMAQGYFVLGAVVTTVLIVFMLEFHKAGHSPCAPSWVRALQKLGLVLSPKHHLAHHHGAHDRNYCLINGHVDRTLGALGIWRFFERIVTLVTGAVPARDDREKMLRHGSLK